MAMRILSGESVPLRLRFCRASGCQAGLFLLCQRCDRGQRYCSPVCRARARSQQFRAANARHQRSPEGRLDHRERQRRYRERQRARASERPADSSVTYPSSISPDSGSCCQSDPPACQPPSTPPIPRPRQVASRCQLCGRPGYFTSSWSPDWSFRFQKRDTS